MEINKIVSYHTKNQTFKEIGSMPYNLVVLIIDLK